jgi:8-oxo-dGTP pyrophosphatase MutT (NUDIX family)
MATAERALNRAFADLAAGITADLARVADADGNVPRAATLDLQRRAADRVQAMFLGRNRAGELAPFELLANGRLLPLSPYMRILWQAITTVVGLPVEQNAAMLAKRLPADVLAVMRRGTVDPFAEARAMVSEVEVFRPNPLAQYEAPHTWVDPRGYRLSDRVWNTTAHTRRQIDLYLETAIREGRGALAMSRELERFLMPSRANLRTSAPYGKSASYDAMRLARTEITRASTEATRAAAAMNPFVQGIQWMLSPSHPKPDICDTYARGGPNGDGVYPIESYPGRPHPQCVTPGQMVATLRGNVPIEEIREGDWVLTHRGRYRPVLVAWSTPHDGTVYRFETDAGTLEVTGNHPVMLRSGWCNAESVKAGDEILYAGVGAPVDGLAFISECIPPQRQKYIVASGVGVSIQGVPPSPIAFDGDAEIDNGKIDDKSADGVLFLKGDVCPPQGFGHEKFALATVRALASASERAVALIGMALLYLEWLIAVSASLRNTAVERLVTIPGCEVCQAWVRLTLCLRYLFRDLWALGWVVVAGVIESFHCLLHLIRSRFAATPVILLPTGGNGVASIAHRDIARSEQVAQDAVGDTVLFEDLITREPLLNVDFGQQLTDGFAGFSLESAGVEFCGGDAVNPIVSTKVGQLGAANGASHHGSLLSLDPDEQWGAESGNSVVGEVANPSQALNHYSMVRSVSTLQYTGNVYNMTVADDHSYTVGGAVVHNCLCFSTYVTTPDPDAIIDALRADIRKARQELVNKIGPVQTAEFEALLLGQTPAARPATAPTVAPTAAPPLPVDARGGRPPAPTAPVDPAPLTDAGATIVWGKDPLYAGQRLNGVALKPAAARNWAKLRNVATDEPALPAGQRISTGLVIVEPDGRMWVVEPTNHFGGYQQTWPKGGLESGLTPQQNALKEAWEESGLQAKITGYVGDFQGTTGTTRYYLAKRTGGAPWRSDWETATVKLVPVDQVAGLLNVQRDRDVLEAALRKLYPERYGVPVPAPVAPPAPLPAAIPDLDQLKFVKRLGGSTGAELFEDATGTRYVVKSGSSNAHVRSEYLADELYRTLGANVPRARLVERNGTTYKIAEYIEGRLLNELTGSQLTAARWQLQKHFAADALLGSWDVIGMGADNIIVDRQGKAWRIDNGGSLLFRAQGAPKALSNYVDELWTLRDSAINQQTFNVFGNMKYGEIANQLSAIVSKRDAIMGQISDPALRSVMTARLDHAADLAQIYRTFHDDKYVDTYIDRFSYHNTWIQSSGVAGRLPQRLTWSDPTSKYVVLVDENGNEFDDLRGKSGIYADFLSKLDQRTGGRGAKFIKEWSSSQSFSSWSGRSRLVKEALAKNRPSDTYYWRDMSSWDQQGLNDLRKLYDHDAVTDYAAALNAFSYETLRRVEVGNRPQAGVLTLIRTESLDVLQKYGMKLRKGATAMLERGAADSTSLLRGIKVEGSYMTEQDVPLHRVIGFYGFGIDKTMYLGDDENELLVLLDDIKSRYVRKL